MFAFFLRKVFAVLLSKHRRYRSKERTRLERDSFFEGDKREKEESVIDRRIAATSLIVPNRFKHRANGSINFLRFTAAGNVQRNNKETSPSKRLITVISRAETIYCRKRRSDRQESSY